MYYCKSLKFIRKYELGWRSTVSVDKAANRIPVFSFEEHESLTWIKIDGLKISVTARKRNRLKLKHENKLQKEFFERKRQQKTNAKTVIPKRIDKRRERGRGSQDLFSLEVIMSAHQNTQRRGEGRISMSPRKEVKDTCKKTGKQGLSAKGPHQHIIPELSPVRQTSQLQPPLEQSRENRCSEPDEREYFFSSVYPEGKFYPPLGEGNQLVENCYIDQKHHIF
ncbi:uncharacterized protein [Montipora foliosa]|uniref:uncharacterized protein isoform X2 n=2 Tax=Montipora foliosa TaxID=591990 RepID=UPI0035F17723